MCTRRGAVQRGEVYHGHHVWFSRKLFLLHVLAHELAVWVNPLPSFVSNLLVHDTTEPGVI
jgi:hypothetical protein